MSKARDAVVELLQAPWAAVVVLVVAGVLGWRGVPELEAARTVAACAAALVAVGEQSTIWRSLCTCSSGASPHSNPVTVRFSSGAQGLRNIYSSTGCLRPRGAALKP